MFFVAAALAAYFIVKKMYAPQKNMYRDFAIPLPKGYTIHGIDVSRYQQTIDWEKVSKMRSDTLRLRFAFIKATDGQAWIDPQYRRNWYYAKKHGLVRGAYHFYRPGISAALQAENFLGIVKLEKGDLPPVLDVEINNGLSRIEIIKGVQTWLTIVESRTGVKPIIYSNASFYNDNLMGLFDKYPLWVAHYFAVERGPRVTLDWHFWQHSEKGRVNGIRGNVDFNVYSGTIDSFEKLRIAKPL